MRLTMLVEGPNPYGDTLGVAGQSAKVARPLAPKPFKGRLLRRTTQAASTPAPSYRECPNARHCSGFLLVYRVPRGLGMALAVQRFVFFIIGRSAKAKQLLSQYRLQVLL